MLRTKRKQDVDKNLLVPEQKYILAMYLHHIRHGTSGMLAIRK